MARAFGPSVLSLSTIVLLACGQSATQTQQPTETTAALCQDGQDNDADGATDCQDEDCQGFVFCVRPSEVTAVDCNDGIDNDSDGKTDCADTGCQGFVFCQSSEATSSACSDGVDNDADGLTDCDDPDCGGLVFCVPPTENTVAACSDHDDNDGDGLTDCDDPDCGALQICAGRTETTSLTCRDSQDNDGDGLVDCKDPDCQGFVFCMQPTEDTASACQDGVDNDHDGKTDCLDPECQGFTFCYSPDETTALACQDLQDNDQDGLVDCQDPDCAGFVFCRTDLEVSSASCQDGIDNDSDGKTDCADSDCLGYTFCASEEATTAACQDGVDNDSDGKTDCADPDCGGFVFCAAAEETSATACRDGVDNDSDGLVDCADPDCGGYTFCLAPTETTAVDCQDGVDNDHDGLTDCADPDCGGFVQCQQTSPNETTLAECQDGVDNDSDGATDCDDAGCWAWSVCGHYHGYPLYDSWGDAWDGIERQARTRADAEAVCASLGGRLPTATELWRNNWTSGTGDLGNQTEASYLWTRIERQAAGQYAAVRLADGSITYYADTTLHTFRCIWPAGTGAGFDGSRCYGPPGATCHAFGRFWNVDAYDRAPLDYPAAANECEFYGASLPSSAEWGEMIHDGLPNGSNNWMWSAKSTYWYNGNYGVGLVRWQDANAHRWYYDNGNMGAVSVSGEIRQFRCVGLARPADFTAPTPSSCNGGCATFGDRRSIVVADTLDRVAVRMAVAEATCRQEGALLPNLADATDLVHAGWANGSNAWNWVADAMYWYNGGYGHGVVRWNGAGLPSFAYYSGTYGGLSAAATNQAYRCVWHEKKPPLPACASGQVIRWNGTRFTCAAGGDGTSHGNANVIEIVDPWGNAWDGIQRNAPTTWGAADQTCKALGGRLPTATELWAVRAAGNPHQPIGDINSTSFLWTRTPARIAGQYVTERVSDGVASTAVETTNQYYRCIWPAVRGDVLNGRNCYGPPGSECFVTPDGIVADTYDRVALDVSAAMEECRGSGGRLPDHRDVIRVIHSGWPNGTNQWVWMGDSEYWYSGGYGYAIARWSGTGTPSWEYASGTGAQSWGYDVRPFRCVYTPELR